MALPEHASSSQPVPPVATALQDPARRPFPPDREMAQHWAPKMVKMMQERSSRVGLKTSRRTFSGRASQEPAAGLPTRTDSQPHPHSRRVPPLRRPGRHLAEAEAAVGSAGAVSLVTRSAHCHPSRAALCTDHQTGCL